jgi:hypothetical protein
MRGRVLLRRGGNSAGCRAIDSVPARNNHSQRCGVGNPGRSAWQLHRSGFYAPTMAPTRAARWPVAGRSSAHAGRYGCYIHTDLPQRSCKSLSPESSGEVSQRITKERDRTALAAINPTLSLNPTKLSIRPSLRPTIRSSDKLGEGMPWTTTQLL